MGHSWITLRIICAKGGYATLAQSAENIQDEHVTRVNSMLCSKCGYVTSAQRHQEGVLKIDTEGVENRRVVGGYVASVP
jgi:hypothetical protein